MWQRDNAIEAVVSAFSDGAVKERDSRGGSVWRWREKKAFGFLQFSEMEERESGGGLKILEDKIVFLIKFIQ